MTSKYLLGLSLWLGWFGAAHGAIVAWTPFSEGIAEHNSGLYSTSQSATLLNWDAPYTTSMLNNNELFWETRGRFRTTLPIATTSHVRMEGSYFGFAGTTAQLNNGGFLGAKVEGIGTLTFDLDSPAIVTISAFNTLLNTDAQFNGEMQFEGRLRLNGIEYITNAADASFTFNVGPGNYIAQFFAETVSLSFPFPQSDVRGDMTANYRIDVVTIPEPSSLMLGIVGLGVVSLRNRQRRV